MRSLVVLIVAASLPLAWFAGKRHEIMAARTQLARAGGHVIYDHSPQGNWQAVPTIWRFASATDLGDGIIWHPYQVSFYPPEATDDTLRGMSPFCKAKVLVLGECPVSNAGLLHLEKFKDLQILDLSRTRICDAGLVQLTSSKNLRFLNVEGTGVSSEGVAWLRQALPQCDIYSGPTITSGPMGIAPVPLP